LVWFVSEIQSRTDDLSLAKCTGETKYENSQLESVETINICELIFASLSVN
jgi:hypothetical protein